MIEEERSKMVDGNVDMQVDVAPTNDIPIEDTTYNNGNQIISNTEDSASMSNDPLLKEPSNVLREGDYFILVFADNRQIFAQAVKGRKENQPLSRSTNDRTPLLI